MTNKQLFTKGLRDGLPICMGYLSVSFAFGIFTVGLGLSVWQAILISMTNVTSAGQLAGVPIMVGGLPLVEMVLTQFVINLRYSLMSVSMSQKLSKRVRFLHRFVIAFMVTDEIFAVSISQKEDLETPYMMGLIVTPFLGWVGGTALGAVAGDVLPASVVSALGLALYAMFVAIVIPPAKKNKAVAGCCLLAVALSCMFYYVPLFKDLSKGIAIIVCAVVSGVIFAIACPVKDEQDKKAEGKVQA